MWAGVLSERIGPESIPKRSRAPVLNIRLGAAICLADCNWTFEMNGAAACHSRRASAGPAPSSAKLVGNPLYGRARLNCATSSVIEPNVFEVDWMRRALGLPCPYPSWPSARHDQLLADSIGNKLLARAQTFFFFLV